VVVSQCPCGTVPTTRSPLRPQPYSRAIVGFNSFRSAQTTLAGIELMHMIKKGQMVPSAQPQTAAQQFYSLAA
jgi:hypothetical protein